jgi:hypothetical protein
VSGEHSRNYHSNQSSVPFLRALSVHDVTPRGIRVKRLIAFASLVAFATSAASAAPAAKHTAAKPATKAHKSVAQVCHVAPADEYFGKLKMSVLGIRNTIKDQGLRVDADPSKAQASLGSVGFAEDALHDWQRKYRCDRWIPWTIYALEHFYGKIHTPDGVKNVHRIVAWLKHDYPKVGGVLAFAAKDETAAVAALAAATATPAPSVPAAAVPAPPATDVTAPNPAPSAAAVDAKN